MIATKERRTSKAYWNGMIRQMEHHKGSTKAWKKTGGKRNPK